MFLLFQQKGPKIEVELQTRKSIWRDILRAFEFNIYEKVSTVLPPR